MTKIYRALSFMCLLIISTTISCKQERQACAEPILVSLRFSTSSTHTVDTTTRRVVFDTVLPYSLLGTIGAQQNQIDYFGSTSRFSLYLNPNADSCTWYLSQDSGRTAIDTITFYYTRQLHFISNACGYTYYYNLTKTPCTPNLKNNQIQNAFDTQHKIDSITVENAGISSNVNQEHLKIYIHNTK